MDSLAAWVSSGWGGMCLGDKLALETWWDILQDWGGGVSFQKCERVEFVSALCLCPTLVH